MKDAFLNRMKQLLGDEYNAYLDTLEQKPYRALRVNTLKSSLEELETLLPFPLKKTPFCEQSCYIPDEVNSLGNHPAHLAGLFYIQEPSASSAVEALDVQIGDWVLDLCAAPGGKSSQIAAKLQHSGFLLSNEIDKKRAAILMSNLERLGVGEYMITSASPDKLCAMLKGTFDKILVDAPCSGEGMFKKTDKAMEDWSEEHVLACANRQKLILDSAYPCLKENGILVYSTCTYAPEENEMVIASFLKQHPDMELVAIDLPFGRDGMAGMGIDERYVKRIFPMDGGEGHFIAKLQKKGAQEASRLYYQMDKKLCKEAMQFLDQQLDDTQFHTMMIQDHIYLRKQPFLDLKQIHVLRQGICMGTLVKQRIEPHQHFYVSAQLQDHLRHTYAMNDDETLRFLQGNIIEQKVEKGYYAMMWNHHPLGFGKSDASTIKNKYPKGLRLMGKTIEF